mgnify:FL=1
MLTLDILDQLDMVLAKMESWIQSYSAKTYSTPNHNHTLCLQIAFICPH